MAVVVKPLGRGIIAMMQEGWVASNMQERAERVAATARANAPVQSGEYQESIEVIVEMHPERAAAHVSSSAPHAMLVEANTGNLLRALGSA